MDLLTNLAVVDEKECVKAVFSKDLVNISKFIAKYSVEISKRLVTEDMTYILVLLHYVDCHNFKTYQIEAENGDFALFPYLPTLLLADEKAKRKNIQNLEVNFPTFCAALHVRDIQIMNSLYTFATTSGVFDIDTNNVIQCIERYTSIMKSIFNKNILPHISKGLYKEVKQYYIEFNQLPVKELCRLYSKNRGHIVKGPSDTILKNSLLGDNLEYYAKNNISPILGDLDAPTVGETVDVLSLYPFNLVKKNGVISGIDWKH